MSVILQVQPIDQVVEPILRSLNKSISEGFRATLLLEGDDKLDAYAAIEHQTLNRVAMLLYQSMSLAVVYTLTDLSFNFLTNSNLEFQRQQLIRLTTELKTMSYSHHPDFVRTSRKHIDKVLRTKSLENDKEGFFDDEEQAIDIQQVNEDQQLTIHNRTRKKVEQDSILYEMLNKLNERDSIIHELEQKIIKRENILAEAMQAHLKDITHLKESLYRKDRAGDYEFYEVDYFAEIIDPSVKVLVESKLRETKNHYETQHKGLLQKLLILNSDNEQLRERIKHLQLIITQDYTIEKLLQKVFFIDSNPYRVWKAIQDIKGGLYFYEVFENQRPSEGINYRMINKMLMTSKAYEREYNIYKSQIDEQLTKFIHNQKMNQMVLVEQVESQNKSLLQQDDRIQSKIQEIRQEYENQILALNNQNLQLQIRNVDRNENELSRLEAEITRYMIKRWALLAYFRKFKDNGIEPKDLKKLILQTTMFDQVRAHYQEREKRMKDLLVSSNNLKQNFELLSCELKIKLSSLESSLIYQQQEIESLQAQRQKMQDERFSSQQQKSILESAYTQILKLIDGNLLKMRPENLNLVEGPVADDFKEKVQNLSKHHKRTIQEAVEQTSKVIGATLNIYTSDQNNYHSVGVQTKIGNVNTPLELNVQEYVKSFPMSLEQDKFLDVGINSIEDTSRRRLITRGTQTQDNHSNHINSRQYNRRQSLDESLKQIATIDQSEESVLKTLRVSSVQQNNRGVKNKKDQQRFKLQSLTLTNDRGSYSPTPSTAPKQGKTVQAVFQRLFEDHKRKEEQIKEFQQELLLNSYKKKPEVTVRTQYRRLPEYYYSSLVETKDLRPRVFLNELIKSFNKNTLRIQKFKLKDSNQ